MAVSSATASKTHGLYKLHKYALNRDKLLLPIFKISLAFRQ